MSFQTIYLVSGYTYIYGSLLTVLQLHVVFFCIMTLCSMVGGCQCHVFGVGVSSILSMKAACSSETQITTYQTTLL
jgi:hypothetical protein